MRLRKWLAAIRDAVDAAADRLHLAFDTLITRLAGIGDALWSMPDRLKLAVLAFALGLPLSYHGLVWMNFKTAKQMTDCRNDLYTGVAAARGMPQQLLDATEAAFKRSFDCHSNVDPRISNLDFAKQQHQRWRDASVGQDPSAPRR